MAQDRSKWYQLGEAFALSGLTMADMMMMKEDLSKSKNLPVQPSATKNRTGDFCLRVESHMYL